MGEKTWDSVVYKESDKGEVLRLFGKYYGESEVSRRSFFEWQHEKSSAGKAIIRLAKTKAGRVVGFYEVLPQDFLIDNKVVKGSVSVNTLVDEEYRGLGIFTKLAEDCYSDCVKRGIAFTIGFPNPNSYPGFMGKLGFTDLLEMPLLLKPLNWRKLLEKKLGKKFDTLSGWMPDYIRKAKEAVAVYEEKKVGGAFDDLFKRTSRRFDNVTIRDKKFLGWRLGLPDREYKIFSYRKRKEVSGYLVLRVKEVDGIKNSFMVDFLALVTKSRAVSNTFLPVLG